jgi:hypothetical protein
MAAPFIPGLRLAGEFYAEVVRPLLAREYPGLIYSAALLGWGSEVLGFDSQRSADHNWGPRLQLFVPDDDGAATGEVTAMLATRLPESFLGHPTWFADVTSRHDAPRHWVQVVHLGPWLQGQLGVDASHGLGWLDWLAIPTQRLAEVTAGEVFHDGLGELGQVRTRLSWYPDDVWRYVLACQWRRIAQEQAFPGRCAEAGDELGSAMVAARLARDLMRLWLLMHRRYPPYTKWLGSAFSQAPGAAAIGPSLTAALAATAYPDRERHLCHAYEAAAALHNQLELTEALDTNTRPYYDRPYQVPDAGRFTAALLETIGDPQIRQLPPVGAIDQYIDSTDALGNLPFLHAVTPAAAGPRTVC